MQAIIKCAPEGPIDFGRVRSRRITYDRISVKMPAGRSEGEVPRNASKSNVQRAGPQPEVACAGVGYTRVLADSPQDR